MNPGRAGALFLGFACLFPAGSAHAQNAAALAKAAARSADAFDSLVTPGALNALRRMTDSTAAERVATPPPAARPAAARSAPPRTQPAESRPAPQTRTQDIVEPEPAAPTPMPVADSAAAIHAIVARRTDDVVELRVVASDRPVATLSEPFRAGEYSRLFITFARAKLALASPPALAEAGSLFAGVDIAERDGGVRIALDVAALGAYEMSMSGDTAVLRLAAPAPGVAGAAAEAPPLAGPDDLALAREAARAGWAAFRRDVVSVASAAGGFLGRAGTTIASMAGSAWHATSGATVGGARRLAGSIPFAAVARALILLALLGAPSLLVLRFLRRRQAAVRAPAEIVGLGAHARSAAVAPKAEKQPARARRPTPPAERNVKAEENGKKGGKSRKPAVTRTTADARLWAARTLAENGTDVAEIARQTGLSREAAILLVRTAGRKRKAG